MEKSKFLHVGITISNMKQTIEFYKRYFGFSVEMEGVFDEDFIASHNGLYRLEKGSYADFSFLKSPNGIVLEVFEFHPQLPVTADLWNKPGYTHICLQVPDIQQVYERCKKDGVYFFFAPDQRETPDKHWAFLTDPDGNLIELQDE